MARILFIDDDYFTLETYQKLMDLYGHEALLAETGEKARRLAREKAPNLIILDRQLPDIDGFALLKQLRAGMKAIQIPIVMVTASQETFAKRALAEGAQAFLTKPLRVEALLDIITAHAVEDNALP